MPSGSFTHDPATEEKRAEEKIDRKGERKGVRRERNNFGNISLLFEEEYSKDTP